MSVYRVIVGLALAVGLATGAFAADDFAGSWTVKQEFQGQERVSTLTIGDGTGTWASQRGTSELLNVKVENGKLTFQRTMNRQGQEFTIDYEATVVDGKLMGKMITPRGEREFVATRAEQQQPSFLGSWDIEMDFQGRTMEAKLDVTEADGALGGKWSSQLGESDLDDIKIDGDVLTFSRTLDRQGQQFTLDYQAKLVDGKLDGTIVSPMGDLPFTGTPVTPEPEEEGGEALAMVNALDADGNGTVSEEEAPEQMKQFFSMIDSNADGGIDAEEMQMVVEYMRQQGGGQGQTQN